MGSVIANGQRSVLLVDECPTMRVRVRHGFTVQCSDEYAPTIPQLFFEDQEIPNLGIGQAEHLIAIGAVVELI